MTQISKINGIPIPNIYTTGVTFNNNIFTFDRTDNMSGYTLDINPYISTDLKYDYNNTQDNFLVNRSAITELNDLMWSSTVVEDFNLIQSGSTYIINHDLLGEMVLRDGTTETSPLRVYPVTTTFSFDTLPNDMLSYVYVDYNGGTPAITYTNNIDDFNCLDKCLIYLVERHNTDVYEWLYVGKQAVDSNRKYRRKLYKTNSLERTNGLLLSTINLHPTITSGEVYFGFQEFSVGSFNMLSGDTFTYTYNSGSTWVRVTGSTSIDNQQYNNNGVLTTIGNNQYKTEYVYIIPNNPSKLYVVYGDTLYNKLSEAELSTVPTSSPPELTGLGILIGRYIVLKDSTTVTSESSFTRTFTPSSVINHNDTGNLNSGDYLHLTNSEYSNLVFSNSGNTFNEQQNFNTVLVNEISGGTLNLSNIDFTTTGGTYNNLVIDSGGNVLKNNQFYIGVNFTVTGVTWDYVALDTFSIYSIDNPSVIGYDLLHNGTAYTMNNTINLYDDLQITGVTSTGVLKLNCSEQ